MKLADVNARVAELGIACENTSIRAVMEKVREAKRKEVEDSKAKGDDPDAVTGASIINHKSKREKNPQVRLSCEGVPARKLGVEWLGDGKGRLLLVFDSPNHPLRHVSFSRTHADGAAALVDYAQTAAFFGRTYGATAKEAASKPGRSEEAAAGSSELKRFERRSKAWEFSDIAVSVVLVNYSSLGPNITESVEVPWPVRADAPTLPGPPGPQAAR
jgi:hypothetical protein